MPHPKLGKVGFVLGGGGCAEGLPQIVQATEFLKAGIRPDYIIASSVGAFNALDLENALSIWKEHFTSPWAIYDLNPDIKTVIDRVLKTIPRSPFHPHENWADLWKDCGNQYHNLKQLLGFIIRFVKSMPTLPVETNSAPKDFSPFLEKMLSEMRALELDRVKSIFDPAPLITTLRKTLDLKTTQEQQSTLHILTRSGIEEHVFASGITLPAEALNKMRKRCTIHDLNSEDQRFRAAMASAALGPFFARVQINGGLYWDTGTKNPFPAEYAMDAGCDTIFCFVKNHFSYSGNITDYNALDALMEDSDVATRENFIHKHEKAAGRAEKEGKKLELILPQPLHQDLQLLWVSPEAEEYTTAIESKETKNLIKKSFDITPADD
ncbi:hypothetical protein A2926_00950 [Candidatus Giovannonibacteria bacterium RIFCSPLOWO2_01_FULL_44_40]|uniref:PNPLA domain-containing protein n=1 Tax=Candidatus Giovannonibacteria bacterium RIFCSPHIGHO2_01_FULL_45_23 TaxID=1798325 RepID=A0A1F5VJ84_9BACT|nr:MAG: hypothetical protein A2834_01350 [Candidatus Giovannonibacteria bacterium RIFCSPHIGHO2_01_FULL_45_23]OGF80081.1 MAG: hypothetical protein A2926_00950 [Candidatus Giovannonibacteria bacterium RIFCSPLOWO2_01_FULL_44_40]